jgi:molecular chaperone HtpG
MSEAAKAKLEFKTELKQLLHLITHSLYSHQEIFLRELISNASDAINKMRFDSLDNEERLEGNKDWKITLVPDKTAGALTIRDNGVGMSREQVVENLGTIARSGTRAFLENLQQREGTTRPDLIGQFGVGFYSAFMVADKVIVLTRPPGAPTDATRWESDGQGEFTIEPAEKPTRGTDVVLHLKDDAKQFLDDWQLRALVKKFSDFIEHPVVLETTEDGEEGKSDAATAKEETLNSRKAIWLRSPKEIEKEEYDQFYQQISEDADPPARVIHYTAEGRTEFKVLAFIPARKPFSFQWEEPKGLKLYIQRVLIMDSCEELLPSYLRFVRGVVDSSDLPLNISREILQRNPLLERIQKNVVRNVLENLEALKNTEFDKYATFFKDLGVMLKDGAARDYANREALANLLLFESLNTEPGKLITLADYVEKMPSDQADIWYLIGESREQIERSPLLELFRAKGWNVLLMTDPIDEWLVSSLHVYKQKNLKAADRGDLDSSVATDKPAGSDAYKGLFDCLKAKLSEVSDIRLSSRLKESASCLVADAGAMSAHMERLMRRMNREPEAPSKRVLELNGEHPAVVGLRDLYLKSSDDPRIETHGRLLYEQAVIAEGGRLNDPAAFARRINELIAKDLGE